MLQAVQFPAGVTNLDTSLTDMDGNTFTLLKIREKENKYLLVYVVGLNIAIVGVENIKELMLILLFRFSLYI